MWFIRLMGRLPLSVLYIKSSVLAFLLYHVVGYRKKVVYTNLKKSFPDAAEHTIKGYTKEFYRRFCDYIFETLHMVAMRPEEFMKRSSISWDPELQPLLDNERPFIILTSHIFNWEWTLHRIGFILKKQFAAVYQKLTNPSFEKYMLELRQLTGAIMVEKNQLVRYMVKHSDDLPGFALLADQTPLKETQKYWTSFLNQETAFFLGPEIIAYLGQMPAFFYKVKRISRGRYSVHLCYLGEAPTERGTGIVEAYVRELEKAIVEDPPGYLWSHRRWKLKREES